MPARSLAALALALATSLGCAALLAARAAPEPIRAPAQERPAPWTALARNLLRREFVVSVGDLIEGYTDDPSSTATRSSSC